MPERLRLSAFGQRFTRPTGALELMDDLGNALSGEADTLMLGGGNPGNVPAVEQRLRARLAEIAGDPGEFARMFGNYAHPRGELRFRRSLAALLSREYGWSVTEDNIALTGGSQSAFFMLFNLFGGLSSEGDLRRILLPMTPEYVGYSDVGVADRLFVSNRPVIEEHGGIYFKYRVDFDGFELREDTGVVCVSRPTNPTGNVLDALEMERLVALTRRAGVPLIVDNAYGVPFPGIVFNEALPVYADHVIYCMSLSKLGLPGLRTGIVVADAAIIDAISSFNAVLTLATGSLGAVLTTELIASGEILRLAREVVRPHYRARADAAVAWCGEHFDGVDYLLHKPEGAIFLWLWFPGLPISAQTLYERLKARQVLVIPGHYFFPGLDEPWQHCHECIRISYAQAPEQVEAGIRIIGEEVRRAFAGA